jgi:hypothetical protein
MKLTKPQAQTLRRKWIDGQHENGSTRDVSFLAFRRTVEPTYDASVMVQWCGMYVGIEPDGYPHT